MTDIPFTDSAWFTYGLLPALIFLARVVDVSIGTVRVIFVSRGMKALAPVLGFFEVLIWILAIGQIMQNLDSWITYVAYAAGFATGNYVGILIENRLALGMVSIRIITRADATKLIRALRDRDFGVTSMPAQGSTGPVSVIWTLVTRQKLQTVLDLMNKYNPHAFFVIEDIRFAREGILPPARTTRRRHIMQVRKMLSLRK